MDKNDALVSPVDQVAFIKNADKEALKALYDGIMNDGLFAAIMPVPKEVENFAEQSLARQNVAVRWHKAASPDTWKQKNFGTPGDLGGSGLVEVNLEGDILSFVASTEDLPLSGYELLVKQGFELTVYYASPSIAGRLKTVEGRIRRQEYDLDNAPDDIREHLSL